jgi:hypothetical protein
MSHIDAFEAFLNTVPFVNITTTAIHEYLKNETRMSLPDFKKILESQPELLVTKHMLDCAITSAICTESLDLLLHH